MIIVIIIFAVSSEVRKTIPVYEEVEGLQVLPQSEDFSSKFPVSGGSSSLLAVAGKNGVVRVFNLEGALPDAAAAAAAAAVGREGDKKSKKKSKERGGEKGGQRRLTCRCVMTQDNASASHRAGYTALLLDPRRVGLLAVTSDHNLVLLDAVGGGSRSRPPSTGSIGSLVTRRQIVGYNDEVIDIKSFPGGAAAVLGGGDEDGREGQEMKEGHSWIAVATNSPQVRLFELGGFSCRLLDGHTDTVLALGVAPDG